MNQFDKKQFEKWLTDLVMRSGGWRKSAAQAGLSHTTLMKAAGKLEGSMDLATLKAISDWSGTPLSSVLDMYYGTITVDEKTAVELGRIREKHPELVEAITLAADLGEDELKDILEYIHFKVSRAKS
jgi:hypothetical protein